MFLIQQMLILTTLLEFGNGIKCYSCESVYDENCGEDFEVEQHFKLDCDLLIPPRYLEKRLPPNKRNATGCLKRIYEESAVTKVQRHCFFGDVNGTSAMITGCQNDPTRSPAIKELSCLVCDNENYCNGIRAPVALMSLVVAALMFPLISIPAKVMIL